MFYYFFPKCKLGMIEFYVFIIGDFYLIEFINNSSLLSFINGDISFFIFTYILSNIVLMRIRDIGNNVFVPILFYMLFPFVTSIVVMHYYSLSHGMVSTLLIFCFLYLFSFYFFNNKPQLDT